MKPNEYKVLTDCVETGVRSGIRRIFKYSQDTLIDEEGLERHADVIEQEITNAICEYFSFENIEE